MPWWLDFIILLFMTSRKRITIIGAATTSTTTLCSSKIITWEMVVSDVDAKGFSHIPLLSENFEIC